MLHYTTPTHHWNYFIAIEKDLETVSRYIEFCEDNQNVYSIELAHIMLSASSEVDVVMKLLCSLLDSTKPVGNINEYKAVRQVTRNLNPGSSFLKINKDDYYYQHLIV